MLRNTVWILKINCFCGQNDKNYFIYYDLSYNCILNLDKFGLLHFPNANWIFFFFVALGSFLMNVAEEEENGGL